MTTISEELRWLRYAVQENERQQIDCENRLIQLQEERGRLEQQLAEQESLEGAESKPL